MGNNLQYCDLQARNIIEKSGLFNNTGPADLAGSYGSDFPRDDQF